MANTTDTDHEWIYDSWSGQDKRLPLVNAKMNTNEKLKIDLHNYIINLPNDILFTDKTGKQYTTKYISTRIGRITKKYLGVAVGTSSINNLFLETLDKDTLRTLRTLSHDRGTSINVLVGHYFNDIDDNN